VSQYTAKRHKSSKCLVCSQDTAQKVLNYLSLIMQAWMFSCFVPPLARNAVVRTMQRTFHSGWLSWTCWALSYFE